MRDEIINIIKKENRKMNPKEILDRIKEDSSVEDLQDMIHELNMMVSDGILRTSTGNTYFFSDLIS